MKLIPIILNPQRSITIPKDKPEDKRDTISVWTKNEKCEKDIKSH